MEKRFGGFIKEKKVTEPVQEKKKLGTIRKSSCGTKIVL